MRNLRIFPIPIMLRYKLQLKKLKPDIEFGFSFIVIAYNLWLYMPIYILTIVLKWVKICLEFRCRKELTP